MTRKLPLLLLLSLSTALGPAAAQTAQAPASPAAAAPKKAVDTKALQAALAARMQNAIAEGFSGSVLIAAADEVLFEQGYGQADPAAGTPVTTATRFNLASSGKLFTAVAVLQLVQQGRLDLDTPVGSQRCVSARGARQASCRPIVAFE